LAKLVTHEQDGLHFPTGDAVALTAALSRLADDSGLCRALAAAGQVTVARDYTWQAVSARLEEIYQTCEARHR
jgi:glycosyltransferase involved in cell wall biosynthesis